MTARLAAAAAVVVAAVAGMWLAASVLAPGLRSAIALAAAWLVVLGAAVWLVTGAAPRLRAARAAYVACVLLAVAGFYLAFARSTTVAEPIAGGVPQSRATAGASSAAGESGAAARPTNIVELLGPVRARAAPTGRGTARVVRLVGGGRRLTLADGFALTAAPGVHVRLATDPAGRTFRDLGALKGEKGDQQYAIPARLALSVYDTVVFWCAPLTQVLATAQLAPA